MVESGAERFHVAIQFARGDRVQRRERLRILHAAPGGLHAHLQNTQSALMNDIVATGKWDKDVEAQFKQLITEFKQTGSF